MPQFSGPSLHPYTLTPHPLIIACQRRGFRRTLKSSRRHHFYRAQTTPSTRGLGAIPASRRRVTTKSRTVHDPPFHQRFSGANAKELAPLPCSHTPLPLESHPHSSMSSLVLKLRLSHLHDFCVHTDLPEYSLIKDPTELFREEIAG